MPTIWFKRFSLALCFIVLSYSGYTQFVTTWKTDNPGTSDENQITIPTTGTGYDYVIDWGDGNFNRDVTGDITHTYAEPGTYTVFIDGDFPRIYFNNGGDKDKLLTIEYWGGIEWSSMANAFEGCSNLTYNTSSVPYLAEVTDMSGMFRNATKFNGEIKDWDVSNVTSFAAFLSGATAFDKDLSSWETGSVVDMSFMFENTSIDFALGDWDISNVADMSGMLDGCGLSSSNYDFTLSEWSTQALQNDVTLGAAGLTFCGAEASRLHMIESFDWEFVGDVRDCMNTDIETVRLDQLVADPVINYDSHEILLELAAGSDVANLKPLFETSGMATFAPESGSVQDFSNPVIYTVTAEDGETTQDWTVSVIINTTHFTTTWQTDMVSYDGFGDRIIIPVESTEEYDYTIYWGDGTVDRNVNAGISHKYDAPGLYTVAITGDFPQIKFFFGNNQKKILEILQWGDIEWESMEGAFFGCSNMTCSASDVPNLSRVNSLANMFAGIKTFNTNMNDWDVSNIVSLSGTFRNTDFNQMLNKWDVSNVTDMSALFSETTEFNIDLSSWDVSSVTDMSFMFMGAKKFDQDLSSWDLRNVISMRDMFASTPVFNGEIDTWDVSKVISMDGMFRSAKSFNQDLDDWDVSSVSSMTQMFLGASAFNGNIKSWNIENVTSMSAMFYAASSFNQDISGWSVGNSTRMNDLFREATSFDQDISSWVFSSNLGRLEGMFDNSGLSNKNYDKLLNSFLDQELVSISFTAENVNYCLSKDARQLLISDYGWYISDQGQSCDGTDILSFVIEDLTEMATIDMNSFKVSMEVEFGTNLSSIAPTEITVPYGATVNPEQGVSQDFSSAVTYTVNSEDGTSQDWVVTVTEAPSTATDITSFVLAEETGSATINTTDHTITIEVANGADLSSLTPTISISEGSTISPASGATQDFTQVVIYTVTAEDGISTQDWMVTATEAPSMAAEIISFELEEQTGASTINSTDHTISIEVIIGTDLSSLSPMISISEGATISPASGATRDFTDIVIYSVTAEDGISTQDWMVTATEAPSMAAEITSFELDEQTGAATISSTDHMISIEVINDTDLSSLSPRISISEGASISPASGATRDFTDIVIYAVTAEDGISTQDWMVTVTEAPSIANEITSFELDEQTGAATINSADHMISIEVMNGTDLSSLTPTINISAGATISPASGATRDFTDIVIYTVTAEDGNSTQEWMVTVTKAPSIATEITLFELEEQIEAATINSTDHTISVEVMNGTDLSSLTPTINISAGATISPANGVSQDFNTDVTYTVTAEDGTTIQDWVVTVMREEVLSSELTHSIKIYPNPVATELILDLVDTKRLALVEITDLSGRILDEPYRVLNSSVVIDVQDLASGIYLLNLKVSDDTFTFRFVKE